MVGEPVALFPSSPDGSAAESEARCRDAWPVRRGATGCTAAHGLLSPRMRNVLQVLQPRIGGVPAYVGTLSRHLLARGWRVTIAATRDTVGLEEATRDGAEIIEIDVGR